MTPDWYEQAVANQNAAGLPGLLQGLQVGSLPPTPTYSTLDVEVGVLVRGAFRFELERRRLYGQRLSWVERRGWLSSEFAIHGPVEVLDKLKRMFADK